MVHRIGTLRRGGDFARVARAVLSTGLALFISELLNVSSVRAQRVNSELWIANGPVFAAAKAGNTLYIAGIFSWVGPYTGAGVPLDRSSGVPLTGFPRVRGLVSAVADDGLGGWFIGGTFDSVGSLPRQNLVHVRSDLTVDAWNPGADGNVAALVLSGAILYVGGGFSSIAGQTRNGIAALDAISAAATSWNPNPNTDFYSYVSALAVSGTTVYIGGSFDMIDGQPRNNIAALDAVTGIVKAWKPNAYSSVLALAVSGNTVYAGGNFPNIGGKMRNGIAALDATTGAATAWNPNAEGDADAEVDALVVSGGTIYAGGFFNKMGGRPRNNIAALEATTGAATAWDPNANGDGYAGVKVLVVSGSTIYAGGYFNSIGGQPRNNIAALSATNGAADAWDPNVNGGPENPNLMGLVLAITVNATTVFVGGNFYGVGGRARNCIAELDCTTGAATAWDPNANGDTYAEVDALVVSGDTVYAGGHFNRIGGQPRNSIASLDVTTGTATAWDPNANGTVQSLALSGSTLYAGGYFTSIGAQSRSHIAALDAATGVATTWNPGADGIVSALAVSGNTIYAGGNFNSIGGQPRNSIAALDASTAAARTWNPSASGGILSLAVSGTTVYAGGYFSSIGGQPRNNIAALDAGTGAVRTWNPDADGEVAALLLTGTTVCAGGAFGSVGGEPRNNIAAIDSATGALMGWNPNVAGNIVRTLAWSGPTVYAGGDFYDVGGVPAHSVAAIEDPSSGIVITAISGFGGSIAPFGSVVVPQGGSQTFAITPDRWCRVLDVWIDDASVGAVTSYTFTNVQTSHTITAWFAYVAVGNALPTELSLVLLGENPTKSPVRFRLGLPVGAQVQFSIYDVGGRRLATLVDGELAAGYHTLALEHLDVGRAPGVYFARMTVNECQFTRRFVVLR